MLTPPHDLLQVCVWYRCIQEINAERFCWHISMIQVNQSLNWSSELKLSHLYDSGQPILKLTHWIEIVTSQWCRSTKHELKKWVQMKTSQVFNSTNNYLKHWVEIVTSQLLRSIKTELKHWVEIETSQWFRSTKPALKCWLWNWPISMIQILHWNF